LSNASAGMWKTWPIGLPGVELGELAAAKAAINWQPFAELLGRSQAKGEYRALPRQGGESASAAWHYKPTSARTVLNATVHVPASARPLRDTIASTQARPRGLNKKRLEKARPVSSLFWGAGSKAIGLLGRGLPHARISPLPPLAESSAVTLLSDARRASKPPGKKAGCCCCCG